MGIISTGVDYYLVFRFIKALVQPFTSTKAYKLGIIDDEGNILKKRKELKTSAEKKAYGYFERMVWNLKKLIMKVPVIGKSLGSFAAASYLFFKEEYSDGQINSLREKTFLKFVWEDLETSANMYLREVAPITSISSGGISSLTDPSFLSKKSQKKLILQKKKRKKKKKSGRVN